MIHLIISRFINAAPFYSKYFIAYDSKLCSKNISDLIIFPKRGIRVVCTLKFIKFVACTKQVYAHDLGFLWLKANKKIEKIIFWEIENKLIQPKI